MDADVVFVNGAVFVADAARSWATTVAVAGDRIVAVGGDRIADDWVGPGTVVVDLRGRLLTPGFQDAHVHTRFGGWTLGRCDLDVCANADEALDLIAEYAAGHPGPWVTGGGWHFSWFADGRPSAELLDRIVPDRPAAFRVADQHAMWVNSRALQLAGIETATPDPHDGRIERLADGSPQGTLQEGAMFLIDRILPTETSADIAQTIIAGQEFLVKHGITTAQEAWVDEDLHRTYLAMAEQETLIIRVRGALWWSRSEGIDQIERLVNWRSESHPESHYQPGSVKLMLDGVCENRTAALLTPYLDGVGNETEAVGMDMIDPVRLRTYVAELDRQGFQCHFHAIGDAAVRNALDAVAAARAANGHTDVRHHIAHLQVVHPDDLGRFRELGVSATMQPLWACADEPVRRLTLPALGQPRGSWQYPFGALLRRGTTLAMGSDWPVSTPHVMEQIAVATSRRVPGDPDSLPFLPDQRISLTDALMAITAGSAYVNHTSGDSGTLRVGSRADLTALSADPFHAPPASYRDINADLVMVGGQFAHRSTGGR